MKKATIKKYLFICLGAVISIFGLGGCIHDTINLHFNNGELYAQIIVAAAGTFCFLISVLFIVMLPFSKWKNNIKKLAFINSQYQMQNENGLLRFRNKITRKWNKKGFVLCIYPSLLKNELTLQLGYEKVDLVINTMADIIKEDHPDFPFSYAYSTSEYFVMLMQGDEAEVNQRFASFTSEIQKRLKTKVIFARISIACGAYPYKKEENLQNQIKKANLARFQAAKNTDKSTVVFYDEKVYMESLNEIQLRKEIDNAILNGELEVYYQPKYDIRANRFSGAEALVKWNHPLKGLVNAGGFIPYAEKSNQIVDIDRYIFRHVLQDIVSWKKKGVRLVPISINLSRNDAYQDDLLDFIKNTIREYGVSPRLIELELTESAISKDTLYITQILRQIRELGIKTDMDDFGTGYSSLAMLYRFPLDVIKIDKSFFDNIEADQKARDIAKSMIALGKTCGMMIVAEGIENAQQLEFVKKTKCDYVQGNYFSNSIKKEDFERLLRGNRFERKETKI